MSHQIYHTEGFILGSRPSREADKIIKIYTRDFGLLYASAQGIRKISSKLRFALQDYSHARIDLVRGREVWRITSGSGVALFPHLYRNLGAFRILSQVAKLLERLCQGEEPNAEIFEDLVQAAHFLNRPEMSKPEEEMTELTLVLRILHNLGYIGNTKSLEAYLGEDFSLENAPKDTFAKKTIIFEINRALKESQL